MWDTQSLRFLVHCHLPRSAGTCLLFNFSPCSSSCNCCPSHILQPFAISVTLGITSGISTCFSFPQLFLWMWEPAPQPYCRLAGWECWEIMALLPPQHPMRGLVYENTSTSFLRWDECEAHVLCCFPELLSGVKLQVPIQVPY